MRAKFYILGIVILAISLFYALALAYNKYISAIINLDSLVFYFITGLSSSVVLVLIAKTLGVLLKRKSSYYLKK